MRALLLDQGTDILSTLKKNRRLLNNTSLSFTFQKGQRTCEHDPWMKLRLVLTIEMKKIQHNYPVDIFLSSLRNDTFQHQLFYHGVRYQDSGSRSEHCKELHNRPTISHGAGTDYEYKNHHSVQIKWTKALYYTRFVLLMQIETF